MPYFRSLSDDELQTLHPLLKNLNERSTEIVEYWHQLYTTQFGESRTLLQEEFFGIGSPLLVGAVMALLTNDLEQCRERARTLGERMANRGVPFIEVIFVLHLYQEAVESVCAQDFTRVNRFAFAKLCQIDATFVAEGYIQAERVRLAAQVAVVEDEVVRSEIDDRRSFHGLFGASPTMRRIYRRIEAACRSRGTVLIIGESGTGKELVARAIHSAGPNPDAPFVAVNCPAIPRDLIESELFGHKRGSFSGANLDHLGLFRAAEGGALFLDEVTEMSLETQSKLLRALQERAVRPVGYTNEVPVKVRVIASTNRRPEEAVKTGLLREDLYYRLQANTIEIPPLRERSEDIPLLTSHFIKIFNAEAMPVAPVTGIAQDAMAALLRYPWPGNVRELSNAIESAITFGGGSRIKLKDLPQNIRQNNPDLPRTVGVTASADLQGAHVRQINGSLPKTFEEIEREIIEEALKVAGNNRTYAAELLNISRKKLYARLAKYGLLNQGRRARRGAYVSTQPLSCTP
jgi:DNA-binding NtrC family response regulator